MYQMDRSEFREQVERILVGSDAKPESKPKLDAAAEHLISGLCPACKRPDFMANVEARNATQA